MLNSEFLLQKSDDTVTFRPLMYLAYVAQSAYASKYHDADCFRNTTKISPCMSALFLLPQNILLSSFSYFLFYPFGSDFAKLISVAPPTPLLQFWIGCAITQVL